MEKSGVPVGSKGPSSIFPLRPRIGTRKRDRPRAMGWPLRRVVSRQRRWHTVPTGPFVSHEITVLGLTETVSKEIRFKRQSARQHSRRARSFYFFCTRFVWVWASSYFGRNRYRDYTLACGCTTNDRRDNNVAVSNRS